MNVTSVKITDNSDLVKRAKDEAIARALEAVGLQAEGNVKRIPPLTPDGSAIALLISR